MFVCSAWWCRPTSVWRSTLTLFVPSVSSGFASWKEFGDHWMPSQWRLLYTLSLHHVWTMVTILVGAPKSVTNKLQRVLNAAARIVTGTVAPGSMTKDCHIYCILSCTGWTSGSGLVHCISLLWWSTDVSRTRRRSICLTTVCQSLKLPVVSNCDLPLVISFYWSHDVDSEHSAVGLLLWLARRSETHWQMNCELTLVIGLNWLWRLCSLPLTSVFSALEAFAVMRYINWWLTLTLTFCHRPLQDIMSVKCEQFQKNSYVFDVMPNNFRCMHWLVALMSRKSHETAGPNAGQIC